MTVRFTAAALDLSRLDRSTLFPDLSFESIRDARIADLAARLQAAGIPFDVGELEANPGAIIQQTGAYRELLTQQDIRDAETSVMLAFAQGQFLDRLGDLHGTARMAGEADDRYRSRIQLAPEAFATAGTPGGYIYFAVSADLMVRDVALSVLNRGTPDVMVEIVVLSTEGDGTPSDELVRTVRNTLYSDDIKLATDVIAVRPTRIINYDIGATLTYRPGPDPTTIKNAALQSVRAAGERYKHIGADVPASAIAAALYVPNVDRVDIALNDVVTQRWQTPNLRNVALTTVASLD